MEFGQEAVIFKTRQGGSKGPVLVSTFRRWRPFIRRGSQTQGFKATAKEYSMLAYICFPYSLF